jgi:hypothetical protein
MMITLEGPLPDFEVGVANRGSYACDKGISDVEKIDLGVLLSAWLVFTGSWATDPAL